MSLAISRNSARFLCFNSWCVYAIVLISSGYCLPIIFTNPRGFNRREPDRYRLDSFLLLMSSHALSESVANQRTVPSEYATHLITTRSSNRRPVVCAALITRVGGPIDLPLRVSDFPDAALRKV